MAVTVDSPVAFASFRGGMNDTDSPLDLMADQVTYAMNVEWVFAPCGERRNGCTAVDLGPSGLAGGPIVHLSEWFPTGDATDAEWFGIGIQVTGAAIVARRSRPSLGGTWTQPTLADPILVAAVGAYGLRQLYRIQSQASQNQQPLLFFAYASGQDRLHVWDQTTIRRAGLVAPLDTPVVVDSGAGTYATPRYFRIRYVQINGSVVLRRSEPSPVTTFTPSGTGAGALITRSGLVNEGENAWELEAGANPTGDFYMIQRIPLGSVTWLDTTASPLTYATLGPLSEDSGDYLPFPSVAYITVDDDRVIGAGHQTDPTRMSSVYWSPPSSDPGVGNNERLPLRLNNTLSLDNGAGGAITNLGAAVNGVFHVYKWARIYQAQRTGDINKAYDFGQALSTTYGALPGSVISAHDEAGLPCDYFLDPKVGPCRIVNGQIQVIYGLLTTWQRVHVNASTIISHGVFYPYKQQIHWWVAVDGANTPSLKLVLHLAHMRVAPDGRLYGSWALADGYIASAFCSAMLTDPVSLAGTAALSYRPFIGKQVTAAMQRCDVGPTDDGTAIAPVIISRPFLLDTIVAMWGITRGTLIAAANATRSLGIQLIKDMGVEANPPTPVVVPLAAAGTETLVVKDMDALVLSELRMVQVKVTEV